MPDVLKSMQSTLAFVASAGMIAIIVGCLDVWIFNTHFGLDWDKTLITGGLASLAGTAAYTAGVRTPHT